MLHQLEKEGRKMSIEIVTTKNVLTGTDVLNFKKNQAGEFYVSISFVLFECLICLFALPTQ